MLDKIKLRLRISSTVFDGQIADYINECIDELRRQGITNVSDTDSLVISCCELYAKYKFNFDGDADWYYKRFVALRDNMSTMAYYMYAPEVSNG